MPKQLKQYATPAAVIAMSAALAGCDIDINYNGSVEGVPLSEFEMPAAAPTSLELVGPADMIVTEGKTFTINLEGSPGVEDSLLFDLDGEKLTVGRRRDGGPENVDVVRVLITMPAPAKLEMTGAGTITADTMAANATADVNGAGDITIANLAAESFDGEVNGSGDLTASGTATQLKVEVNGSGDAHLEGLMAEDATAEVNGSGDIVLASNGTVSADINGSGDIRVIGTASCSSDVNGSGDVVCGPAEAEATAALSDESGEAESTQ